MVWLRDVDRWFIDQVLGHGAAYRTYARRSTRDVHEADDLVQEAYARVLAAPDWRLVVSPERFVYRTLRNLAMERFRRARVVAFRDIAALDAAPDPSAPVEHHDELRRVRDAMARLPPRCRKVVILRKAHGLSPVQIKEKLHISVSTVEKRLAKGLRLLTETLAEQDRRSEGARVIWLPNRRAAASR
ncbi:MAG: sigma-70 family RNA polymerase sigma factor [Caulobacteraceae bacterium]